MGLRVVIFRKSSYIGLGLGLGLNKVRRQKTADKRQDTRPKTQDKTKDNTKDKIDGQRQDRRFKKNIHDKIKKPKGKTEDNRPYKRP